MEVSKLSTRKQSAEILDLTPQQFDYWQRQLKIEPLKFGYNQVLYTDEMLVKAKLALLLKEHKLSKNYIHRFLENLSESIIKLSELFLVKSEAKLDKLTFPKIQSDQYLLTKEEAARFIPEMVADLISKDSVPGLNIERIANLDEIVEQIEQKRQQIKAMTDEALSILSDGQILK